MADAKRIEIIDAYFRAANYLSVGQIYLKDNPPIEGASSERAPQEKASWPLWNISGIESHLCPSEPAHPGHKG